MILSRRTVVTTLAAFAGGAAILPFARGKASAGTLTAEPWAAKLVAAARSQIGVTLIYDPGYTKIAFPGGDVARVKGVCTDVIVRAYRDGLGVDLQQMVNADMLTAFSDYPKTWGLKRPDSNIDHRRVPNLQAFFRRKGSALSVETAGLAYQPGDIVTQMLPGNKPHIVIVGDALNADGSRPLVIHNIGWGAREEDTLFQFPITGRYRFKA